MKLTIHDDPDLLTERLRNLKKLKTTKVKVGLPESAGGRLHFILAIQEHGSPIMRIPSRPVVQPALAKDETRAEMAKAMKAAKKMKLRAHCGPLFTSDAFYSESSEPLALQKLGVMAVEMEAAALYMNAAVTGKSALAICTISDHTMTGEALPAEERQNSFLDMIRLGLEIA